MSLDLLEEAVNLIRQGDESGYIEKVAEYCNETGVKPDAANNAVAFGHCEEIPFYMDSKVESKLKELSRE